MEGKAVLLVDDDSVIRTLFSHTLRQVGVTVIEAENAQSALEQLSEGIHIDAVITDYRMPGMNGIDFANVLDKQYPLMLVSSDELTTLVAKNPSIRIFRQKPLTPGELLSGLRALIHESTTIGVE